VTFRAEPRDEEERPRATAQVLTKKAKGRRSFDERRPWW